LGLQCRARVVVFYELDELVFVPPRRDFDHELELARGDGYGRDETTVFRQGRDQLVTPIRDEFDLEILESITEDLAEKRNEIVHSGIESPVYVRDVNLLRQLLCLSIEEMLSLRNDKYTRREIMGVLKRGLKDEGQLEKAEMDLEEERSEKDSMLEEIEGARRWQKKRRPIETSKQTPNAK
jgi:hypothetical protein